MGFYRLEEQGKDSTLESQWRIKWLHFTLECERVAQQKGCRGRAVESLYFKVFTTARKLLMSGYSNSLDSFKNLFIFQLVEKYTVD